MTTRKRLEKLEEAQREWERNHVVPMRDVVAFLHDLTLIVGEEAGQETAMRVLNRIVKAKAEQVDARSYNFV